MRPTGRTPKRPGPRPMKPRRTKRRRGAFRRIRLRLMTLRPLPWRGRHRRGAGALLGVLLLTALAGAALAVHYEARGAERAQALDRAAGRVFAAWVQAAHRATQAHADLFETALETQVGILLTVARLRALGAAAPGLPERPGRHAAMVLGVIADGTAQGVPGGVPLYQGVPLCRWPSGCWNPRCRLALPRSAPARWMRVSRRSRRAAARSWRRTVRRSRPRSAARWRRTRSTSPPTAGCATGNAPSTAAPSRAGPGSTAWRPRLRWRRPGPRTRPTRRAGTSRARAR